MTPVKHWGPIWRPMTFGVGVHLPAWGTGAPVRRDFGGAATKLDISTRMTMQRAQAHRGELDARLAWKA